MLPDQLDDNEGENDNCVVTEKSLRRGEYLYVYQVIVIAL